MADSPALPPADHPPLEHLKAMAPPGTPGETHETLSSNSFASLPTHLKPLARQIRNLRALDLVAITEMTQRAASKEVFSTLQYTGGSWYLPEIRECRPDEKHWECRFDLRKGVIVAIGGKRMELLLWGYLLRLSVLVLLWFSVWNILPHQYVEPKGVVWDPIVTILVSALIGGLLCRIVQIPPLIGVLWIAIMWTSIPSSHYLTAGIDKGIPKIATRVGITFILARAGFSTSLKAFLPTAKQTAMLCTLPMVLEAITHSFIANKLFEYNDYTWAFAEGFACSIVSPAIVVPAVLYLQDQGVGKGKGPLTLMLSSCGLETAMGVWAANFILGLIFHDEAIGLAIALGPIQFIVGVILGLIFAYIFHFIVEVLKREADRMPDGHYSASHFNKTMDFSFLIFVMITLCIVFYSYALELAGGGAICTVVFSATVSHLWVKDGNHELEMQKKHVGAWLSTVWDLAVMPYLFAMVGSQVEISSIFSSTFFPKAIVVVVCSGTVRALTIFALQTRSGLNTKEKLLVCVGYCGKAGSQASLSTLALQMAQTRFGSSSIPPNFQTYTANYRNMAVLYILVYAPIAAISLVKAGPYACRPPTEEVTAASLRANAALPQVETEMNALPSVTSSYTDGTAHEPTQEA